MLLIIIELYLKIDSIQNIIPLKDMQIVVLVALLNLLVKIEK